MSIIGIWDTKELDKFIDKLKGLSDDKIQKFNEDTVKEIAARTLAKLIAYTPVGEYKDKTVEFIAYKGQEGKEKEVKFEAKANKVGGTLNKGWTGGKDIEDAYSYVLNNIEVMKKGRTYYIILSNPIHYASYVEYGHRTVDGKGWVEGKEFVKLSEDEMQEELPGILEKKLNDFLGEYFNE